MLNTPLVETESATKPAAFPLKTFFSSQRPSIEYSEQPGASRAYVCCFDVYVYKVIDALLPVNKQEQLRHEPIFRWYNLNARGGTGPYELTTIISVSYSVASLKHHLIQVLS